ncbi:hypothetical protein ACFWE3_11025 [Mycobacteriaceae bacterium NPDC060252]
MPSPKSSLQWIPEGVANVLHANGIDNRLALSNAIRVAPATVYRVFNPDWSGKATSEMVAILAEAFNVSITRLVAEPAAARAVRRNVKPRQRRGKQLASSTGARQ